MKVLIADDHALMREGLAHVLAGLGDDLTILHASDGTDALALIRAHPDLDLVLLDINMPGTCGFDVLARSVERDSTLPVAMLSASLRRADMQHALDLGAMGFIPKALTGQQLIQALRLILAGGIYVPPALVQTPAVAGAQPHLTDRQREVLAHMARGHGNKRIARELDLAEATVKMHVTAIMKALGACNRTEAVLIAQRLHMPMSSWASG